jgi:hypothetical protein
MWLMTRIARFAVVIVLSAAAACAPRTRPAVVPQQDAAADDLIRQGCYDCLLEARTAYERLPVSQAATLRLIEVNLLLALREKELALDPAAALDRATSLAARVPAALQASPVISIVAAVPEDATGRRLLPPTPAARDQLDAAIAGSTRRSRRSTPARTARFSKATRACPSSAGDSQPILRRRPRLEMHRC